MISVDSLNPFIQSAHQVFEMVCQCKLVNEKIVREEIVLNADNVTVMLGVTGSLTGQVCITMTETQAKDIASKMMCGMPVPVLDDLAKSAISELGNMIMGNAATILSTNNVLVDITPPTLITGNAALSTTGIVTLMVPMKYENEIIKLYFVLKVA